MAEVVDRCRACQWVGISLTCTTYLVPRDGLVHWVSWRLLLAFVLFTSEDERMIRYVMHGQHSVLNVTSMHDCEKEALVLGYLI